ncbi:MAG: nitronate monooxygenase [Chitinophagales bacterium]
MHNIDKLLNIQHPIIQAPMLGVTTPEMVAAALRAGCLGSLPLGDADAETCAHKIRATQQLTDQPFAVNIFVNDIPPITEALKEQYDLVKRKLTDLATELQFEVQFPEIENIQPKGYPSQLPAIIASGCKVLSFTFGNLDKSSIDLLHQEGFVLIGTCNSLEEAIALEQSGIDMICVQGIEAGGHRGTFHSDNIPMNAGFSLLQNVRAAVSCPLIYAGGIKDKKSIAALATLGADGYQVGSLLICSKESALHAFQKERVDRLEEAEIILTRSFSGRYARGIKNTFIDLFEDSEFILPYPYQNKLTQPFRAAAKKHLNHEWLSIWVGESFRDLSRDSTETILKSLQ